MGTSQKNKRNESKSKKVESSEKFDQLVNNTYIVGHKIGSGRILLTFGSLLVCYFAFF